MNFIIGAAFLLLVNTALANKYCRKGLCPKDTMTHIACESNGRWADACGKKSKFYPLTDCDIELILDMHNKHRNDVASGSVSRYAQAANMKEVTWNTELAEIACYNAIRCEIRHDECRSTAKFKYAGQNLAITGHSRAYRPFQEAYKDLHNQWFAENQHCDMHNMRQFKNKPTTANEAIGHFTQLVSDKVDQVGCCVSMFEKNGAYWTYIVCNYSYMNIMNKPIYAEGRPQCKRFSEKYKCLCAE